MSEPDNGFSSEGMTDGGRPQSGSMPFFPPPPSGAATPHASTRPAEPVPPPVGVAGPTASAGGPPGTMFGAPVHTPAMASAATLSAPATRPEATSDPGHETPRAGDHTIVKGRIRIEDEVIEKIAMLAALEVHGVAALSGDPNGPPEALQGPAGRRRRGARAIVQDSEVTLDLVLAVSYGTVVMEVAKAVKTNVARVVGLMLGIRVATVNVTIDDVRMPTSTVPAAPGG